jgi:hypothetical protein
MRWRWILGTVFVPLCVSGLDFTVDYAQVFGSEPLPRHSIPPALGLVTLLFVTILVPGVFVGQWLALRHRVPSAALWLIPGLLVTVLIPLVGVIGQWIGIRAAVSDLLALIFDDQPRPSVRFVAVAVVVAAMQAIVVAGLTAPVIAFWSLSWRRWLIVCFVAWTCGHALMMSWREWGGLATTAVIGSPLRPVDPDDKSWPTLRLNRDARPSAKPDGKPSTVYRVSSPRLLLTTTIVKVGTMLTMWLTFGWITAQFFWLRAEPAGAASPASGMRRRRLV